MEVHEHAFPPHDECLVATGIAVALARNDHCSAQSALAVIRDNLIEIPPFQLRPRQH